jgi:hypothetical protein
MAWSASSVPFRRVSSTSPISSTCRTEGISRIQSASFLRYRRSVVTMATGAPISTRERIGSGPKAENSGVNTQPCFSVPRAAAYRSGDAVAGL